MAFMHAHTLQVGQVFSADQGSSWWEITRITPSRFPHDKDTYVAITATCLDDGRRRPRPTNPYITCGYRGKNNTH